MFKIEHVQLDSSFTVVDTHTTIESIKDKLLQYSYIVVTGTMSYTIAKHESPLLALEEDVLPISSWFNKVKWLPSTVSTILSLSAQEVDWRRPVLLQNKETENIIGILTENQWIRMLAMENQRTTAYFYTLADTINDAVTAVDQEGNVICWNTAAEATYNIRREEILGRKIGEHFRADSIFLHQILNEGRPVRGAYHRPTNDTHVLINASPITANNQIIGGVATEHDITRIVRLNEELDSSVPLLIEPNHPFLSVIGISPEIERALQVAQKVAYADIPVLITGESGTGKEMLAQAIHYGGSKRTGSFEVINCSAFPSSLLEMELFGYQEGAFTDEKKIGQAGKLEQACDGTLFIEEIDKMPLNIQEKVLHYLEKQSFCRVGGTEWITTHSRIIASTSQSLEKMTQRGEFNEKLYYRIAVISIELPALRRRTGDIMKLAGQFVKEFSSKYKKEIPEFSPEVITIFINYDWPGNVRELRNVIERCILLNESNVITSTLLPTTIRTIPLNENLLNQTDMPVKSDAPQKNQATIIEEALQKTYGNKSAAAQLLGISRGTLYNKIREYGLNY